MMFISSLKIIRISNINTDIYYFNKYINSNKKEKKY